MKELSEITAGFVDHGGLYQPLAQALADDYKRVLYWDPKEEAFESINDSVIGDSYPENPKFERVDDIWARKSEIDLFVFPDSKGGGLQLELESQGFPVWGGRQSQIIEQSREIFIHLLNEHGFEVPPYKRIVGIDRLREYLKERDDQIIKISKYRGTTETKKWVSMDENEAWLDLLAVNLGGIKNLMPFLVFESIDTDLEIGCDTYSISGKFPKLVLDGTEAKDMGYFSALKPIENLPSQTSAVMEVFGTVLGKFNHRGFWSVEIRVKGDHFYFIDPTPRAPLPGSASQIELYGNLGEIIAAGADGELVEPEPIATFSAEAALTCEINDPMWRSVRVPEELRRWVKLSGTATINGRDWFPPGECHGEQIGWLVAVGDTPSETIETLLGRAKELPPGIEAHTTSLIEIVKEIENAKKEKIVVTRKPMPEVAAIAEEL